MRVTDDQFECRAVNHCHVSVSSSVCGMLTSVAGTYGRGHSKPLQAPHVHMLWFFVCPVNVFGRFLVSAPELFVICLTHRADILSCFLLDLSAATFLCGSYHSKTSKNHGVRIQLSFLCTQL